MRVVALSIILVLATFTVAAEPTILTGTVTKVRDGDTIEVGNIPIRLNGVSAPEMDEPLGPESRAFMVDLVDGQKVQCELNGQKTYDRWVGTCYVNGRDIGAAIIRGGLARDCPRYSNGRYKKYETAQARSNIHLPSYC